MFLGLDNGQVYDKAVMVSWGDDKLESDRNVKSQVGCSSSEGLGLDNWRIN